jgi:hypothetical protein
VIKTVTALDRRFPCARGKAFDDQKFNQPGKETKMKYRTFKLFALVLSTLAFAGALQATGPSPADVGEADSFSHPALYMGAASGFVTLATTCPSPTPTPSPPATANDNQCFALNPAPALTTFTADDICRIKLPKKATRTIIYPVLNFFQNYQLQNTTGGPIPNALFDYSASLSIESDVLLDPSIIDPATGLPANGKLVFQFAPNRYQDDRSMNDGDRYRNRFTFARAGNAGINKAQMVSTGLSQTVVDALFVSAMTIRMNVTGSALLVTDASITFNMRLFGD